MPLSINQTMRDLNLAPRVSGQEIKFPIVAALEGSQLRIVGHARTREAAESAGHKSGLVFSQCLDSIAYGKRCFVLRP